MSKCRVPKCPYRHPNENNEIVAPMKPTMTSGDFSTAGMTNLGLSIQYFGDILFSIYRHWSQSKEQQ